MNKRALFDVTKTPLAKGTTLIEASAGTGKTFTIAGLFLRLVVEHDLRVQEILVATYTVAATAELRDRIRQRLRDALAAFQANAAAEADDIIAALLAANQGCRAQICERLDRAIRNFDEAPIFSLHGFCHRMLGDRAFESGVLFDAELVPDQRSLLREIAEDFWRIQFLEGDWLPASLALKNGLNIAGFVKLLDKLTNHPTIRTVPQPARSFETLKTELATAFGYLAESWAKEKNQIRDCFSSGGNAWAKASHKHGKAETMGEILSQMEQCFGSTSPSPAVIECLPCFAAAEFTKSTKKSHSAPVLGFFTNCDRFLQLEAEYALALKLEFLRWAAGELEKRKVSENVLSFDDLQMRLLNALRSSGGEKLARSIRSRFAAALVDEFQDTDPVQYEIFERIYRGSDAWLFFIGDPKQAIYGFRGADVFTYMDAAEKASAQFTLGTNWRSESRLVQVVNELFSRSRHAPFVFDRIPFDPVKPAGKQDKTPLLIAGQPEAPFQLWLCCEQNALAKTAAEEKIANAVAAEISRLLQSQATLGTVALRPHDIAVLSATHKQAALVQDALNRFAVPNVLHSSESVFQSAEATELAQVLEAVVNPGNETLVRSALATEMLGCNAQEIAALPQDDHGWEESLLWFRELHDLWSQRGFIQMFRSLMIRRQVRSRLLQFPDGERRLTNVLHLSELLHQACVEQRRGMNGLLKWLAQQMSESDAGSGEEDELRLERDENAVRIVTMHKSKGLEYPIVFCPFAWPGSELWRDEIVTFHDAESRLTQDLGSPELDDNKVVAGTERLAEKLRLLYVAVTRAKNRCYVVWGNFTKAETSPINYLLSAPASADPDICTALRTHNSGLTAAKIQAAADEFARHTGGLASPVPMPEPGAPQYRLQDSQPETLKERTFNGRIVRDWRIASFSSLTSGQVTESPDYDSQSFHKTPSSDTAGSADNSERSIFTFPRGTEAGTCLHKFLERIDFQQPAAFEDVARLVLREAGLDAEFASVLSGMAGNVVSTPLDGAKCLKLADLPKLRRLCEFEFHFPISNVTVAKLAGHFAKHGCENIAGFPASIERLSFQPCRGFMKGFVDLIFEHDGRYYILDWKSNWLGDSVEAYDDDAIRSEMLRHHYGLQYHLYCVALHRHLAMRLNGYRYEKHFGGVFYLFLRGIDPAHPACGIYRDRPSAELLLGLDALLNKA